MVLFHMLPQGGMFGLTVGGRGEEGFWSAIVATSWSRGGWGIRRPRPSSQAPSPAWAEGSGWSGRRLRAPSRTSPPARQTGTTASAWWCAAAHLQGAIGSRLNDRMMGGKTAAKFKVSVHPNHNIFSYLKERSGDIQLFSNFPQMQSTSHTMTDISLHYNEHGHCGLL